MSRKATLRINVKFDKLGLNVSDATFKKTARNAENIARKMINDSNKSGVKYYKLPNQSSAPGEAPASQSGALASSIRSRVIPPNTKIRGFQLESNVPYAAALEFGFEGRNLKMRPYLRPARSKAMKRYTSEFRTENLIKTNGKLELKRIY